MSQAPPVAFADLGLPSFVLSSLAAVGYESPSPIQAQTIPSMLAGHDVLGQAQTGTGKTAAFALPLVANIDLNGPHPQALILTPTRELAIQVAEALQKYASHRPGFHVLPIYGGQNYTTQIRSLKRGVHAVVGTPGRIMDHMRKGTLSLAGIRTLVLDEADEMLRMGFIDDVEWILERTPGTQQIALFSATMPAEIKRITKRYLKTPTIVTIKEKTQTAATIRQRVWMVSGVHKLDGLTRILETEPFEGAIIFTRTKIATDELAEKLQARGYSAAALNGDMQQKQRSQTVEQLKNGKLDIVVATDVAARGLDVERISHVINYDIPYDTEAYVHRIGRTGRAGRAGEAILFAAPREQRMLRSIERATGQPIESMRLPSARDVNEMRIERFKDKISQALADTHSNALYRDLIEQYQTSHNVPAIEIAAALAKLAQGDEPLLVKDAPNFKEKAPRVDFGERGAKAGKDVKSRKKRASSDTDLAMEVYRLDAGASHGVSAKHVVGAIANEAGIESEFIGNIKILDTTTLVELPSAMPKDMLRQLQKARLLNRPMNISRVADAANEQAPKTDKGYRSAGKKPDSGKKAIDKKASTKNASSKSATKKVVTKKSSNADKPLTKSLIKGTGKSVTKRAAAKSR